MNSWEEYEFRKAKKERLNSPWFLYRKRVWELTEQVSHLIQGIEKRGRKWHIDHIASIRVGFDTGIPPEEFIDP